MLKVLHVNTYGCGGAFTGLYRLHQALRSSGVDSKILIREGLSSTMCDEVYCYSERFKKENLLNRSGYKIGVATTAHQKRHKYLKNIGKGNYEVISFPFSDIDITQSYLYKEADVVNLHWIGDYVDFETFFKKNSKPIVWTIRDANPLLGVFHLKNDYDGNSKLWQQLDQKMRHLKAKKIRFNGTKIKVVGISEYMTTMAKESELLGGYEAHTLYNCIDTDSAFPITKERARQILQIDQDKIVFSFVADQLNRENKGFREFKNAICSIPTDNMELLSCGKTFESFPLNIRYRPLGTLTHEQLKLVYTASDAFVFPTKEEALGNVMLEAMACGTPVIGTPVGGLLDIIEDGFNGIMTRGVTVENIREGIVDFLKRRHTFDPMIIRKFAEEKFDPKKTAENYTMLYVGLVNNKS